MPHTLTREQAITALEKVAEVFNKPDVGMFVGPHFSCREADAIAEAMLALGDRDGAGIWLSGHATGDEPAELEGTTDKHRHLAHGNDAAGFSSNDPAVVAYLEGLTSNA